LGEGGEFLYKKKDWKTADRNGCDTVCDEGLQKKFLKILTCK
jgi:hypothetical protein